MMNVNFKDSFKRAIFELQRIQLFITKNSEPKIFCVGRNKTGTTSLTRLFRNLRIPVAPQRPAELLLKDWINNGFTQLIKFVKYGGVAFQDIPFSLSTFF